MTVGEHLRRRHAELKAQVLRRGVSVLEAAYEDPRSYWIACGQFRAEKAEMDRIKDSLGKLDGGDESDEGGGSLDPLEDDRDDPAKVAAARRPTGNRRPNGSRPREWGGR